MISKKTEKKFSILFFHLNRSIHDLLIFSIFAKIFLDARAFERVLFFVAFASFAFLDAVLCIFHVFFSIIYKQWWTDIDTFFFYYLFIFFLFISQSLNIILRIKNLQKRWRKINHFDSVVNSIFFNLIFIVFYQEIKNFFFLFNINKSIARNLNIIKSNSRSKINFIRFIGNNKRKKRFCW